MTVYGLPGMDGRVPTFLINVDGVPAEEVAARLAAARIGVWAHDSWYSLDLYPRLGYAGKSVRVGFIHYNLGCPQRMTQNKISQVGVVDGDRAQQQGFFLGPHP